MPGSQDELPLTGSDLDEWCAGRDELDSAVAQVQAGLDARAFNSWLRTRGSMILDWDAGQVELTGKPDRFLRGPGARVLREPLPPYVTVPGPLRLSVTGNMIPAEVIPRLLRAPRVGSVIVPATRPPGALRRRPWRWPPRIAVHQPWEADVLAEAVRNTDIPVPGQGTTHRLPPRLIDLHQVGQVGVVDVLVLDMPLDDAVAVCDRQRTLANAVVVLDRPPGIWPIVDAQLAAIRASTGAVVCALGDPPADPVRGMPLLLGHLLTELSHSQPFDVAITVACGRAVTVVGEIEALLHSDLASATRDLAEAVAAAVRPRGPHPYAAPPRYRARPGMTAARPPRRAAIPRRRDAVGEAVAELEMLADGAFHGERYEASAIPDAVERVHEAAREYEKPRYLQARIGPKSRHNVLREGANKVSVFIGPATEGTLRGPALSNRALGLVSPEQSTVRLTVLLIPLSPRGPASRTEIDVPRLGASQEAQLTLHVPSGRVKEIEARLVLPHWNRVIQTGVIRGKVGEKARLENVVVISPEVNGLESRLPFDAAFLLNHDRAGVPALMRHTGGSTWVQPMRELDAVTNRIQKVLLGAVSVKKSARNYHESLRKLLIELALSGNNLFNLLQANLGDLSKRGEPNRIQIVTARSGRFLPLEFVYPRRAPDPDAKLCEIWKAGGTACGPGCFADDRDRSVVCPNAFWGMSKIIERQYVDGTQLESQQLVLADPKVTRTALSADAALVAASVKVAKAALAETAKLLGGDRAESWEEWVDKLAATDSDLLVLMPHTTPDPQTLEISGKVLRLEYVEPEYVTGGRDTAPIVLLIGCDTSGNEADPAGFCTRFMQKNAGVVFSSLTMLHSSHAPPLTQLLVSMLRDKQRKPTPMGDLVAQFRRQALQDGLVAALAITAYGEADKKV